MLVITDICKPACVWIGGHKPPGHDNPVSGKAGRNPQDITRL